MKDFSECSESVPSGFYARASGRNPAPIEILNKYAALESESSNEDSELQDLMGQHEEEELRIFIEAQRAFEEQAAQESELFELENPKSGEYAVRDAFGGKNVANSTFSEISENLPKSCENSSGEGTLNAIEPPPPAPRGPCEDQCPGTCGHRILCARTRRRRQGFAGHSTQR